MSRNKNDELLNELFGELTSALLKRVKEGATASDLNVARQFLKDNGIEGQPKDPEGKATGIGKLAQELPELDDDPQPDSPRH